MTRRCKVGQRARIISDGWNRGKIVVVVRPYFGGPLEDGSSHWPNPIFPWVVHSLGAPLRRCCIGTGKEKPAKMMAVYDDCDLKPLDDDDDGLTEHTDTGKPAEKPVPVKAVQP